MPYGADQYTLHLEQQFNELFEKEVTIFPVVTGSTANALALSVMTPPFGAIYCHQHDFWLNNARHTNNMAQLLAQDLVELPGVKLCHKVEANEIFIQLP